MRRRSMPWAEGNQVWCSPPSVTGLDECEAQLRRMSCAEDGITDARFSFSEPETGARFWCPPVSDGLIDLRALGL
jgi:porphyrinogen peroxidase